ncbi:unnamed protein product [Knipowitschia caucasica]
MRPRCLLSCVDRLPTINESQELDLQEVPPGRSMVEYMDSIRELSQPPQPCYPLHGPLRGHSRWATRATASASSSCPRACAARTPIELSDVFISVTERYLHHNVVMDTESVFAGL